MYEGKLGDDLTNQQWKIIEMVIDGFNVREAARQLGISPRTAEILAADLKKRLGAKTMMQAAVFADRKLRRGE